MPDYCPICDAPNHPLGRLGHRTHYRCRQCGWMWSIDEDPPDYTPEDDPEDERPVDD